mgnify:FL=1
MTEDIHYQVKRFRDAVYRLSQPRMAMFDQEVLHRPGLYDEIREAMAGEEQGAKPGSISRSVPPVWTEALEWLCEVDSAICCWGFAVPTRFEDMLTEEWGAEYVKEVAFYADVVERWVAEGEALLTGPTSFELKGRCPECDCEKVRRRKFDGWGWSHALSVSAERAVCLSCFAKWPPSQFLFLGRLLGCESATELLAS